MNRSFTPWGSKGLPVVATGDVHFWNRKMPPSPYPPHCGLMTPSTNLLKIWTTEEMLAEFSLGEGGPGSGGGESQRIASS